MPWLWFPSKKNKKEPLLATRINRRTWKRLKPTSKFFNSVDRVSTPEGSLRLTSKSARELIRDSHNHRILVDQLMSQRSLLAQSSVNDNKTKYSSHLANGLKRSNTLSPDEYDLNLTHPASNSLNQNCKLLRLI